uniref:Uncharacterized protein n=1 Tax=Arundo donax TaxID=35708 RepID=A0A0A8ZCK9_ARUDO
MEQTMESTTSKPKAKPFNNSLSIAFEETRD